MATPRTTSPARFIVIAWTETAQVWDGEDYARDLGRRPRLIETTVAKACTWLMAGTKADVRRAKDYARTVPNGRVYTFKVDHGDPLATAKRKALAA